MNFLRSIVLAAVYSASALPATANQMQAVMLSGSEVLVTHFLSQPGLPLAALRELGQFEDLVGYQKKFGVKPQSSLKFSPLATFDPNVTGGVPNDSISVAGLDFAIDPDFVSKSDILLGMGMRGSLRRNLAPTVSLDAKISASIGYAPRVDVTKASAAATACIRKQVNRSRYIHGCAGADFRSVKLGDQAGLNAELGFTQAFNAAGAMHALTAEAGVRKVYPDGSATWTQGYARLSTASALRSGTAIITSLELAEAVRGVQATRLRASIGAARQIKGRPASITAFYAQSDGGQFLGRPRKDETFGLAASYQLNDKISLSATVSQTTSNAQLFDSSPDVGVGIQLRF